MPTLATCYKISNYITNCYQLNTNHHKLRPEVTYDPERYNKKIEISQNRALLISKKEVPMLRWALIFLVIAFVAAVLGFGGIAGTATSIAKILFFVFLALFILSLIFGRRIFPRRMDE
jgi:uncharacterized membrane protein YtjA (UPF0391 family)